MRDEIGIGRKDIATRCLGHAPCVRLEGNDNLPVLVSESAAMVMETLTIEITSRK